MEAVISVNLKDQNSIVLLKCQGIIINVIFPAGKKTITLKSGEKVIVDIIGFMEKRKFGNKREDAIFVLLKHEGGNRRRKGKLIRISEISSIL